MKAKLTIGASLFTAHPRFKESLLAILDSLVSAGGTYVPELVEFERAGKIQSMLFSPDRALELAELWKGMPFNSWLHFQRRSPIEFHLDVGNTLSNFYVLVMSIHKDYLIETNKSMELLSLLKKLYSAVHPAYGNVGLHETVRWSESTFGKMNPGTALKRALPDIYWANFFGPEYVEMFGLDRVDSAPVHSVERFSDGGVLMVLSPSPLDFLKDRDGFERLRLKVKQHLGEEAFDKGWPETQGKVPRFRFDKEWKAEFERWRAGYLEDAAISKGSDLLSKVTWSEWKNWIEDNPSIALAFVSELKGKGLVLDFSEDSLYKLDEYVDGSGWSRAAPSLELVQKLGAYVTQVVLRQKGAQWSVQESKELPSLKIGEVEITPLARVLKVLQEGDKLGPWYNTIDKVALGFVTSKPSRETGRLVK